MNNGGGGSHAAARKERDQAMPGSDGTPHEVDLGKPNVARMYDYYLGGKENYPADREAARLVLGAAPDVPLAALENREFLKHATRFLTREQDIRQFVDIGPGLPTQGNVHQLARRYDPGAHVVYVDNDAVVLSHSRSLLHGIQGVSAIRGDVREPGPILADPELRELINFSQPGALTDIDDVYDNANAPLVMRRREQVAAFFNGFDLVEPGVVFLSQWRPSGEYHVQGGTRWGYCGVGKKP